MLRNDGERRLMRSPIPICQININHSQSPHKLLAPSPLFPHLSPPLIDEVSWPRCDDAAWDLELLPDTEEVKQQLAPIVTSHQQ